MCVTPLLTVISVICVKMLCVFLGFIGNLCSLRKYETPFLLAIDGGDVCDVTDLQTCAEVHLTAKYFAVNPSFSCKVVVSVGTQSKKLHRNVSILHMGCRNEKIPFTSRVDICTSSLYSIIIMPLNKRNCTQYHSRI